MRLSSDPGRLLDRVVLLFVFAVFVLVSPLNRWWAAAESPWYLPYLIWLALIGLAAWLQRRRGGHDL
jgi:hypothetical protein